MKIWNLKFASYKTKDDILNFIIDGSKTLETRSRNPNDKDDDYTNIKVGDILKIVSLDNGYRASKNCNF